MFIRFRFKILLREKAQKGKHERVQIFCEALHNCRLDFKLRARLKVLLLNDV